MRWKGFIRVSQIIYKSYRKDKCITIISTGYTLIIRGMKTMNQYVTGAVIRVLQYSDKF